MNRPLVFCCLSLVASVSAEAAEPSVSHAPFGTLADGSKVEAYTLTNASGMQVRVLDFGGIITTIKVPDRQGKLADVVLGFDSLDGYVKNEPHLGSFIGRYANRIGKAQFTLDGKTYTLAANDKTNTLHGGIKGFDKVLYKAAPFSKAGDVGVTLTRTSPAGEEGFPGALAVKVTFTLNGKNELLLDYSATTDAPTVLNLTHHDYFNLAGEGSGNVLGTLLQIDADQFTPVDATLIPLGKLAPVAGTPLDFRKPTAIGARIESSDPQMKLGAGYDHNFVVNHKAPGDLSRAARAVEPKSGRVLEVRTTEPGVQFYSANWLNNVGKNGHKYGKRDAFCLETQHYPDSPNKPMFPITTLRPGQTFHSQTVYAFSVQ